MVVSIPSTLTKEERREIVQQIVNLTKAYEIVEILSDGLLAIIETVNVLINTMDKIEQEGIKVQLRPREHAVEEDKSEVFWEIKVVS